MYCIALVEPSIKQSILVRDIIHTQSSRTDGPHKQYEKGSY